MVIRKPDYYDGFRCVAGACPDSCCQEWDVAVDPASARYYRDLTGPLGDRLRQVLYEEEGSTYLAIEDRRCPMWRADGLCRIQAELGEDALCKTCREFPRLRHDYGSFVELQLELSCPEAARILLNAEPGPPVTETEARTGEADYDREAMTLLLDSRETALELLSRDAIGSALAALLLYACRIQGQLDGGEGEAFDPRQALEGARAMAQPWDPEAVLDFFLELEILTPAWEDMLRSPRPGAWDPRTAALARYLIQRYWLQAVSDYDLYSRAKLIVVACLLVKTLGGDFVQTAQRFSKEIENSADNLDAVLDAAYTHRAFADAKLLGALLTE